MISIIVPVYKTEKYLRRCIDSLLHQTYENLEIILVDDGSPDRCPQICDAYAKKEKKIKVIHKENGGVSSARNRGMNFAEGDYILFVDSDDYIEPDMCEVLKNNIIVNSADFSVCGVFEESPGKKCERVINVMEECCDREKAFYNFFENGYEVSICNKLFPKSVLNSRFREDLVYGEDMLFFSKILLRSENISFSTKPLYHYNNSSEGITNINSISKEVIKSEIIAEKEVAASLSSISKDVEVCLRNRYYRSLIMLYYKCMISNRQREDLPYKEMNYIQNEIINRKNLIKEIRLFHIEKYAKITYIILTLLIKTNGPRFMYKWIYKIRKWVKKFINRRESTL